MSGAIYQAAAGALLQQMRMEVLSNNLANINTTGYKADAPDFRVDTPGQSAATAPATPGRLSPYAPPMEARTDFSDGPNVRTGNPLDAAIVGDGFFAVQTPEGIRYTRNGSFTINASGLLSTSEGWPVMGQGGEIAIDGSRVEIGGEGDVSVDGQAVDTLQVVTFNQPQQLEKAGNTLFKAPQGVEGTPVEAGEVQVAQGFLEGSNVNAIRTMTDMIETMRVFESYQRVMRSVDETTAKTVAEVGRSA